MNSTEYRVPRTANTGPKTEKLVPGSRYSVRSLGFSLVEMTMAIVIISIIATVAGPLFAVSIDAIGLHTDRVDLEESADLTISRMSREMRRLRNDQSVVTASGTQFEFVDVDSTQIRYRLVGNTLMRRQGAGTESGLADNVQTNGLTFTYFDDDGNTIATPTVGLGTNTDIRRIRIQTVFQFSTHTLPIEIEIRPRNLRHQSDMFF